MSGAPNENLSDNCRKKGRDAKSEVDECSQGEQD